MKRISAFALSIVSITFAANVARAAGYEFECSPEIGKGEEIIRLNVDFEMNTASITVNDSTEDKCTAASVNGELVEYGQSKVILECSAGAVELKQDYDETILDISTLKLGLSDTRYMCN